MLLAGIVAGAAIITPGVGLAAKLLTERRASNTFVRNMSAERGGSGTIRAGAGPQFSDVTIEAPTSGFLLIQAALTSTTRRTRSRTGRS